MPASVQEAGNELPSVAQPLPTRGHSRVSVGTARTDGAIYADINVSSSGEGARRGSRKGYPRPTACVDDSDSIRGRRIDGQGSPTALTNSRHGCVKRGPTWKPYRRRIRVGWMARIGHVH